MIHKFLRVLATGIAEDTGKIMRKAYKNLTEIPSDDQWKEDLHQVFLTENNIQTIPNGTCPKCTQLSMLLLNCNVKLNHITDEFFNNMPALKILDLSETAIQPKSMSNLKCLIALLLSGCTELRYIPSLETLKRLISLDLSFTAITKAPVGLESLVNLRCLNLLKIDKLVIPPSLISKLINLECLELGRAQCLRDALVQSAQSLEKLEVIRAHFPNISVFNAFVRFMAENRVIRSYQLTLYHEIYDDDDEEEEEKIDRIYSMKMIILEGTNFKNREAVLLPRDIKKLFIIACFLGIGGRSLCNILSYVHNNNPHQIELLDIKLCEEAGYLCCCSCPFCSSSQLVGRLDLLEMNNVKDLVSPYADSLDQSALFSHLIHLTVTSCSSMKTLIAFKLLALLQNLRTICVYSCKKMKEIVGEDHSVMELTASGDLMARPHPSITLPNLTSLKLDKMPQLDVVYKGIMLCPSLQTFDASLCEKLNPPQIAISNNGSVLSMQKIPLGGYYWRK
ncbi:disease resistance protein RPS2-like [Neltuma alba]|uniref:disease resistance protein RPS2-like n=1 Tax=Neltuma alba TaxID=207710 RepID=UPI0010A3606F|nr:disease resistance protein RPS2-like [Prosopis alba]